MLKFSLMILILINSLYAAKTIEVEENLKKNFAKHQTYQIRLTLAESIVCEKLNLCEKVDPIIYGLISKVKITAKTFSETISKDMTMMRLDVLINDLKKKCEVLMVLQPKHLFVTKEGDLDERPAFWDISQLSCK